MPFFPSDIENMNLLPFEEEQGPIYHLPLSLDRLLVTNPPSTFFARVAGSEKDLLVIDKSVGVEDGNLVVAYVGEEFVLKRVQKPKSGKVLLTAQGSEPIPVSENATIWGRVVYYIKSC